MDVFPLADVRYSYQSTFDKDRHRGTDLFAPEGSPVLAVTAGSAYAQTDPKGGKVVFLQSEDGRQFYYAHLADWEAPPLRPQDATTGVHVEPGDLLGYVGTTGNASGGKPHLHIQIWSAEGELQDPYHWLRELDPHEHSDLPDLEVKQLPPASRESENTESGIGLGVLVLVLAYAMTRGRR